MNNMYAGQIPGQAAQSGQAPNYSRTQSDYTNAAPQNSLTSGWFSISDPGYVKGLVLGAGLTYLLTNPKVQHALVKGAVSLWATVQGGFEEVKEQIQDIKSEMSMKHEEADSNEQ